MDDGDAIWECIVVGGGAAGLSATLVLGRARRRTLLIDAGGQSNLPAAGVGGLLGHDGRPPAELYAAARAELSAYSTVELKAGRVLHARRQGAGFVLELEDGTSARARRLLLATGMDYRYPRLPGIAERWGGAVFHCPFCHGWEVRDLPLGVLDGTADGVRRALLLKLWSDDITLLPDGPAKLGEPELKQLRTSGVAVDDRRVAGLDGEANKLEAVVFEDGSRRQCRGLLVPVTLHQRGVLARQLGAAIAAPNPLTDEAIEVDTMFHTTVPGLFAAGDVGAQMPSVAHAVAAGSKAAAAIVHSLVEEGLTLG